MPLEVRPVTEEDVADFSRIQYIAFSDGIASFLSPRPAPPDYLPQQIEKNLKSMREEPDCHFMKVVDTDLGGKIIAGAKWRINREERTEEQIQIQLPKPGKEQEGNEAAIQFMNHLARQRQRWMGTKPFYCKSSHGPLVF